MKEFFDFAALFFSFVESAQLLRDESVAEAHQDGVELQVVVVHRLRQILGEADAVDPEQHHPDEADAGGESSDEVVGPDDEETDHEDAGNESGSGGNVLSKQ